MACPFGLLPVSHALLISIRIPKAPTCMHGNHACMATPHSCRFINTIGNPYFLCQPNHLYFNRLQLAILRSRTLIKDPVNADHVDEVSLIGNATTAVIIFHHQRRRRAPLCLRCLQGVHPRLCPLRQWPSHRSSFAVSGEFKTKRTWMRLGRLWWSLEAWACPRWHWTWAWVGDGDGFWACPWWQWIRVFELEPRPKSVMEMGALGLPMVMDSGLEKKPNPDMLMEGNVFSNKWVVVDFRVWACPWRWIWAWVGA